MIPYTTPTLRLTIAGIDLTDMDVYVTIEQGTHELTLEDADVSYADGRTTVAVALTQQQTAAFSRGTCDVQVNWLDANGTRSATVVRTVNVGTQLLQEVLPEEPEEVA